MKLFNFQKTDKLIEMLKRSRQDFRFSHKTVRSSLLSRIKSSHLDSDQKERFNAFPARKTGFAHRLALTFAVLVLFVGTTAALALADNATIQEKVILKLPLPQETKAHIHANIVSKRLDELTRTSGLNNGEELKAEAVKASEHSLTTAVEQVAENREKLKNRGKTEAVEKMDLILGRLEDLAEEHEDRVKRIHNNLRDDKFRGEVELRLGEIKKARLKARVERTGNSED